MFFTFEKIKRITSDLAELMYSDTQEIGEYKYCKGKAAEGCNTNPDGWQTFTPNDRWGGKDTHFWFKTQIKIPERFDGKTVIYEVTTGREGQWDACNPQFLIYVDGNLVQGLDVNHREIILSECAQAGRVYSVDLDAYSGMNEGLIELNIKMSILDKKIKKLYYDIKVALDVAGLLNKDDKARIDILNYLNEAVNLLDFRKPYTEDFYCSIKSADEFLEKEFYGSYCGHNDVIVNCVGHTHIDVAWLWTLAQTREKTARSFSTVLNLMKQYPEYIFMSSQPQLYKYIKEDHPKLYKEIKQRVKEGRWEPEGAMWLEADCNLSSGESLVRQVLFGTRFFEKEFGVRNRILWLPDVFGYSAALPQILKKSGIDYFMTTKISWNEYNKMPYDTFMWRGMDGSEVLTHFITTWDEKAQWLNQHATTYNGNIVPSQVSGSWKRYQQKNISNEVLISFGYGDGGGGPTGEMLENASRLEKGIPGCPKVKLGTALDFFNKLEHTVSNNKKLPKWVGELYLEYHRGTYTSMARNKKYNRKSEFLFQDAEMLSVMNMLLSGSLSYPKSELNSGWETILLNQFHDILPGSSIKEVYEDSRIQYEEVLSNGYTIIGAAIDNITANISTSGRSAIVFNQLGFSRSDIVSLKLPEACNSVKITDSKNNFVSSQLVKRNGSCFITFLAKDVPPKGYKAYNFQTAASNELDQSENPGLTAKLDILSNSFFNITLDKHMNICSIFDKINNREILKTDKRANVFQAFEDKPSNFDSWDINIYYQEKMWEINDVASAEVVEEGPVRASIRVTRKFLDSTIKQDIIIYNNVPRIDFATSIDWKEKQILLKTAFPVDIHSDKAAYEIQYGNVERPTHWNTSWDAARFEVCAHKWADLSEDAYGVSLLNDCKYGHDIKDGTMRLTLIKSGIYPNEDADKEQHEFTYSLYPHSGGWRDAGTVEMAYSLNCPMYTKIESAHAGSLPKEFSIASTDSENVIIEVIKQAEDSSDIIIRLYECYNRRTKTKFSFARTLDSVWECDLLENELSSVQVNGNSFSFVIKPYEIKTFKLKI